MSSFKTAGASFFKQMSILFSALLFGQLMVGVMLLYVKSMTEGVILLDNTQLGMMSIIMLGFSVIAFTTSKMVYQKLTAGVQGNLPAKLRRFRSALIIRYALIEGVTILSFILFIISGEVICLLVGIASLIYFASLRPTRQRAIYDLNLSAQEQQELKNF